MRLLPLLKVLVALLFALGGAKEGDTTQSAVDLMVLMKDFSAMDESFYLSFDPKDSVDGNANNSFKHFMQKAMLDGEMTGEELELFRERFVEEVEKEAHRDHLTSLSATDEDTKWKDEIKKALEDQKPAVTAKLVAIINEEAEKAKAAHPEEDPWHAEMHEWQKNISKVDMTMLSGFTPDAETKQELDADYDLVAESTSLLEVEAPSSFDGRDKWPKCKEVMSFVRDQGLCGSCWAQAAAGAMDGRLCVATGGKFSGPNAQISAGYIASCFNNGNDGCRGGHPGTALRQATQGVPTEQCSPYFGAGDALNHFKQHGSRSPACPTQCKGGSKSLAESKFVGSGGATTDLNRMKASMVEGGSIAIGFKVFKDFMSYKNGIYTPRSSQSTGMHATTALAYGTNYILSANSWGTRWGDKGFFKISSSCCNLMYFVPDKYSSNQPALPGPSPPSGEGGIGPLLGAKFIEAATEAQVRQCTGGALLLDVDDSETTDDVSEYTERVSSARRRRRSKKDARRRRRRSKKGKRGKRGPKPAAKGSRCVLYFGSASSPPCNQMKPSFPQWAKQADATILAVPRSMWGQFGVKGMPTLKAYKNGKDCGSTGQSGSAWKSTLDQCSGKSSGGGSSPQPSPKPSPQPSGACSKCPTGSGCYVSRIARCFGPHNGHPGDHSAKCSHNGGTWCGPKYPQIARARR